MNEHIERTVCYPYRCVRSDVLCMDKYRVELRDGRGGDYICHASYVSLSADDKLPMVICTQGPTETTIQDFYRMVLQEKCTAIIMLCANVENGKVRPSCHRHRAETPKPNRNT